jgi:hypothetical protein
MDDLERKLAAQLHRRSEQVTPGDDVPGRIRERVHRRQRQRRVLLGAAPTACLLIAALAFVAVGGSGGGNRSSSSAASTSAPTDNPPSLHRSPAPANGSTRPPVAGGPAFAAQSPVASGTMAQAGWVPIDDGNVQISVPPGAVISTGACPSPGAPVTVHLSPPPAGVFNCPFEPVGVTTVTIEPLPAGTSTAGLSSSRVHGVTVFPNFGSPGSGAELVPSLGAEVQASGPEASAILGTLTTSPRTVALSGGHAPPVPGSWRRVTFGGLSVAVPTSWPVQHAPVVGTPCALEPVWESRTVIGSDGRPAVILDTGPTSPPQEHCAALAPAPLGDNQAVVQPSAGLVINPGGLASGTSYGRCRTVAGLRVCPARDPQHYGELVLGVRLPDGKTDTVVIGLTGNGQTARTILNSMRPA